MTADELIIGTQKLYKEHLGKLLVFTGELLCYSDVGTLAETTSGSSFVGEFFILCDVFTDDDRPFSFTFGMRNCVVLKILKGDQFFYIWHYVKMYNVPQIHHCIGYHNIGFPGRYDET